MDRETVKDGGMQSETKMGMENVQIWTEKHIDMDGEIINIKETQIERGVRSYK